ncbi:MAG: ATP-binding cassette domain-containing protein [Chloroflexi bacterium]|nr:ATP-binding cassette domain-containing protein [Chloroflexota bacterium]
MEVIYQLNDIQKVYAGRTILDLGRVEILRGEVLAVVGPSGAGKSTLLRLLNFLEEADRGELLYEGQLVGTTLPLAMRREVTTVFQSPALLQDSVETNVAYGLRLRGIGGSQAAVGAALEQMGLAHLRKVPARTLSGGEAQRVALARAIVLHPKVLLLDEPTANLDPYNIGLIEQVVRDINQREKTSIILVTHNVFQAKRLAHRVALLLNGQIVEMAPAREFFENPRDLRTRAFTNGEMVY